MKNANQQVHLQYFAILREQSGRDAEEISTDAATARDLYLALSGRYPFTLPPERISVAINDSFCPMDQKLNAGDRIVFIPPVAGG